MEKFIYYNNLYTIYKSLLTEKKQEIFKLYYEDNYSLQEIAEKLNVSKSYIGNSIKNSEKKLTELEKSLKIYQKETIIRKVLNLENIQEIKKELKKILN
ncbi:MAG: hypothetical protein E7172_02150 [Firmicutes bacterium]|nr:hypothetical protein [Bacillota bacterium]